jgi:hypothetical protein
LNWVAKESSNTPFWNWRRMKKKQERNKRKKRKKERNQPQEADRKKL